MGLKHRDSAHRLRVLVVAENEQFGSWLEKVLIDENCKVSKTSSIKATEHHVSTYHVDLVFIDVYLPTGSGIQLMHQLLQIKNELSIIFMTGHEEFKHENEVLELGAKKFLRKPFKKEAVLESIFSCFPEFRSKYTKSMSATAHYARYCKVPIQDFLFSDELKYDVFICIGQKKYIKIFHKGDSIPRERFVKLRNKIHYLYLIREDFHDYMGMTLRLAPVIVEKKEIPKAKKFAFLKHTSEVIMEQLLFEGLDETSFENARTVVENTASLVTDRNDLFVLLDSLNQHANFMYAHSLGVSLYSVMIARAVR